MGCGWFSLHWPLQSHSPLVPDSGPSRSDQHTNAGTVDTHHQAASLGTLRKTDDLNEFQTKTKLNSTSNGLTYEANTTNVNTSLILLTGSLLLRQHGQLELLTITMSAQCNTSFGNATVPPFVLSIKHLELKWTMSNFRGCRLSN